MEILENILKSINPDILGSGKKIVTDGLVDSVDLVGIVSEIEEQFGIEIPIEEISPDNFDDVESIWNMIKKLQ